MGEVYLAYTAGGDPVAVKLIRRGRIDPEIRDRFAREAEIVQSIVGTSRVAGYRAHDAFTDQPWIAMEFVSGLTLNDYVREHAPLPAMLTASLGILLAEGLQTVHRAGLLHRDLKPLNVIMSRRGPVVIDFGLGAMMASDAASLSTPGWPLGTPRYMPPEQARGESGVTTAADVYGLGAVLVYAATGHDLYDGNSRQKILDKVRDAKHCPDLTGLPAEIEQLVSSMLAHDPEGRPDLTAVQDDLSGLLQKMEKSAKSARRALILETFQDTDNENSVPAVPVPAQNSGLSSEPVEEFEPSIVEPEPVPGKPQAQHRIAEQLRDLYAQRTDLLPSMSR